MNAPKSLARTAGFLYLIVAVCGGFSELYVRASMIVPGNAAATAAHVVAHATLFRLGFITDLVGFTCFLLVGVILYSILKSVNIHVAVAMLVLNAVSVAISALNMLNHLGALLVATNPIYTAGMPAQTSHALVLLLLDLHQQGYLIAQIFFGLFLLPLGYLVFRSGYFPRVLGIILIIGCAGYLADDVAIYLSPGFTSGLSAPLGTLAGLAEVLFLLWLIVRGAKVSEPKEEKSTPVTVDAHAKL
jgi:hypothetical protein